jgi:hypothetical protein
MRSVGVAALHRGVAILMAAVLVSGCALILAIAHWDQRP